MASPAAAASPIGTVIPAPAAAARSPTTSPADETTGTRPHIKSISRVRCESSVRAPDGAGRSRNPPRIPGDALVVGPPRGLHDAVGDAQLVRSGECLKEPGVRRVRTRVTASHDHEPRVRNASRARANPRIAVAQSNQRVDAAVPEHQCCVLRHEYSPADPRRYGPRRIDGNAERNLDQRRIGVRRRVQAPGCRKQPERVQPLGRVRDEKEVAAPQQLDRTLQEPREHAGILVQCDGLDDARRVTVDHNREVVREGARDGAAEVGVALTEHDRRVALRQTRDRRGPPDGVGSGLGAASVTSCPADAQHRGELAIADAGPGGQRATGRRHIGR